MKTNLETLVAGNKLTDGKNVYVLDGVTVLNTVTNKKSVMHIDTINSKELEVYQPTEAELEVEKLQKVIAKQRATIVKLKGGKVPGKKAAKAKKEVKVTQDKNETPVTSSKVKKTRKRIKFTAAQTKKFEKLVDEGMNTKDLAKEFKVPYYAAYHKRIAILKAKETPEVTVQKTPGANSASATA